MYQFDKCSTKRVILGCNVMDTFNQYLLGKGLLARRLEDVVHRITHGLGICISILFVEFIVVLDSIKVSTFEPQK